MTQSTQSKMNKLRTGGKVDMWCFLGHTQSCLHRFSIKVDKSCYDNIVWKNKNVFTRMFPPPAHPSSLSVGTTHGVFFLEPIFICNAVCKREGKEFVYTDSTYYFYHGTALTLLTLFSEISLPACEINAYGDFLQALGQRATVDYMQKRHKEGNSLVEIRRKIFLRLKGTALNVILLNNSKFYHVGTTEEYLFHFTADPCLRAELGLLSAAFSVFCVTHSILHPSVTVSQGSVVEYSRLDARVKVGSRSIISSCIFPVCSNLKYSFVMSLGMLKALDTLRCYKYGLFCNTNSLNCCIKASRFSVLFILLNLCWISLMLRVQIYSIFYVLLIYLGLSSQNTSRHDEV
uniref:Fucose-1-phosphate guanylyltransferase n=1 Tax=Cyprinus carpio TaxID=7962 RepID=A0A8C1JRT9_CYPCA